MQRRCVLITGAGRGLGLELARQYAADGWDVVAGCRQPEAAGGSTGPTPAVFRRLDVCDAAAVGTLAAEMDGRRLDVLINNAAVRGDTRGFAGLTAADFHAVMATNVLGALLMVRAFLAHLGRARPGIVVNIGSRAGSMAEGADPDRDYAYRCSKAALNQVTTKLADDYRHLVVMSLHPGWVRTDMGGPGAEVPVDASARGLRTLIAQATPRDSGTFRSFDGATIAW